MLCVVQTRCETRGPDGGVSVIYIIYISIYIGSPVSPPPRAYHTDGGTCVHTGTCAHVHDNLSAVSASAIRIITTPRPFPHTFDPFVSSARLDMFPSNPPPRAPHDGATSSRIRVSDRSSPPHSPPAPWSASKCGCTKGERAWRSAGPRASACTCAAARVTRIPASPST